MLLEAIRSNRDSESVFVPTRGTVKIGSYDHPEQPALRVLPSPTDSASGSTLASKVDGDVVQRPFGWILACRVYVLWTDVLK